MMHGRQDSESDRVGILDNKAPRFLCAGRFVAIARALDVSVSTLNTALNQRDGSIHRYWRVDTGAAGESQWPSMRDGGFVSIGWSEQVPNLPETIDQDNAKDRIRDWLLRNYPRAVASRKASEIVRFAQVIAENDLVLACEGQDGLAVGHVRGPYEYASNLAFPHKRRVDWLLAEQWRMPRPEGLQTTVCELGKSAANLLELEQRMFRRSPIVGAPSAPLPPLDALTARMDSILRRKGQAVLYGSPGTGKTYSALAVVKELAARQAFCKTFATLTDAERAEIMGPLGQVRLCTQPLDRVVRALRHWLAGSLAKVNSRSPTPAR